MRLREIKETIVAYRERIRKQVTERNSASSAGAIILKYLARYGNHLFGHPAQAALAANLRHPEYVRVLCGSLEHLSSVFAWLDRTELQETSRLQRDNRNTRLLKRIGALIADERLQQNNGNIDRLHVQACGTVTEI